MGLVSGNITRQRVLVELFGLGPVPTSPASYPVKVISMDPTATAHAATATTDYLLSLGLPGVIIMGLSLVAYLQYKRNNELTDKLIEQTGIVATVSANSTAALNRFADMLQIKRESGAS